MGAWKSSDGGSIRCLGASSVSGDYAATTDLVGAGVNVRGIILRTAVLFPVGAGAYGFLRAGGIRIGHAYSVGWAMENEIFIRAGLGIQILRVSGSIQADITYDIL